LSYPPAYGVPSIPATGTKGGFLSRLGPGRKAAVLIGGGVLTLMLVCCGGGALISAMTGGTKPQSATRTQGSAVADTVRSAETTPPAAPLAQPKVETTTVTETSPIAFSEKTVNDSSLAKGTSKVKTAGVDGVKTLTYEVTLTDGVETGRKVVSDVVTTKPVDQVTAVGTKAQPAAQCDPNYTGACVPIASDVDCAGGTGNGPAYVKGPVTVIGTDIYKLDTDHDGIACEN
jgi:hypothetical protein